MIEKFTNKVFENIDWTEKYGTLESGIYKLERNVIIDEYECPYYVIFEIK